MDQVVKNENIAAEVADIPHLGKENISEVAYQLAWARTYLKNYGVITNSSRSSWPIQPDYINIATLDKDAFEKVDNLTVLCYPGTYGLIYAREHGFDIENAEI